MPDNKNLLNLDDLADVFAQLNDIEDAPKELTEEEKASQRRYEEIIKKHKNNNKPNESKRLSKIFKGSRFYMCYNANPRSCKHYFRANPHIQHLGFRSNPHSLGIIFLQNPH